MKFGKTPLFCTSCRKELPEEGPVLLLEDNHARYFCTEACAEKFYTPIVKRYKDFQLRLQSKEQDSLLDEMLGDPSVIDALLYSPNEVWMVSNLADECVYHFISELGEKDGKKISGVCASLVKKFKPSFVITLLVTKKIDFVNEYRCGVKLDAANFQGSSSKSSVEQYDGQLDYLSEEIVITLEKIKSELLAIHLENRNEFDVPYEHFTKYDHYLQLTLDAPDEIRAFNDLDTPLWCYIKSGRNLDDEQAFFYLVICLNQGVEQQTGKSIVIPVFSFPTIDSKIYNFFRTGKKLFGPSQN